MYWTELFWPSVGGVEVHAQNFVRDMYQRGHTFMVITGHGSVSLPDEAHYLGVPVYRFRCREAIEQGDLELISSIARRIGALKDTFRPDVVQINFSGPGAFFHLHTLQHAPSSTLTYFHVGLRHRVGRGLLDKLLRCSRKVVANSKAVRDDVRQMVPGNLSRIRVVYPGLKEPALAPAPLPFSPPQLLCVGRLVRDKGMDIAVRALHLVVGRFPGTRLVIAGDGPARSQLEHLVRELGLEVQAMFSGWVAPEMIPTIINTSTLVMVPSRVREAFGLVALQAGQMGRPVIASRTGGLPELVVDGETGILVTPDSPGALAQAVLWLLSHQQAARDMGQAGRERAETEFGWERHLDAFDQVYRGLAGNHEVTESNRF